MTSNSYRLISGYATARINSDDLGEFVIADRELIVDDAETADALCAQFGYLEPHPDGYELVDDADDDPVDETDADEETDADGDDADGDAVDDDDAVDEDEDDLDAMGYTDLQALAKANDIRANLARDDLVAELREADLA